MLKDLVLHNRSYRRFFEDERISEQTLRELVELARNAASAGNAQALRFRLIWQRAACAEVFSTLGWAASLPEWPGPVEGERPAAYIVVLAEKSLGANRDMDVGIAAQTILLGAAERGLGGCMLGNVKRAQLMERLQLDPERYALPLVIALGRPKEDVRLTDLPETGKTTYYRDENGVHYVPKRALEDLIV